MTTNAPSLLAPASELRDYLPLLKWLLVMVLTAFGFLVLWYFGLVQSMIALDKTRVSVVILGVFVATSLHCLYQTVAISRELVAARRVRDAVVSSASGTLAVQNGGIVTADGKPLEGGRGHHAYAQPADQKARRAPSGGHFDQTLLLRSLADQLRSREKDPPLRFGVAAAACPARHRHRLHPDAGAARPTGTPSTSRRCARPLPA